MTSGGCDDGFLCIVSCNATGGDACAYQSLCGRGTETGEINEQDGELVNQIGTDRVDGLALGFSCFDSHVPGDEKTVDVSGLPR